MTNYNFRHVGEIITEGLRTNVKETNVSNVDNVDLDILNNVDNVKPDKEKRIVGELVNEFKDKPEAIAEIIAKDLGDLENLNFHKKVVKRNSYELLFECLAIAKDAARGNLIRTTPARYYVGVLKKKNCKW